MLGAEHLAPLGSHRNRAPDDLAESAGSGLVRRPGGELSAVMNGATRCATGGLPGELLADAVETGAETLKNVSGDPLTLDEQAEQKVLGAHLLVAHRPRLAEAQVDYLLNTGSRHDLADDNAFVAA